MRGITDSDGTSIVQNPEDWIDRVVKVFNVETHKILTGKIGFIDPSPTLSVRFTNVKISGIDEWVKVAPPTEAHSYRYYIVEVDNS